MAIADGHPSSYRPLGLMQLNFVDHLRETTYHYMHPPTAFPAEAGNLPTVMGWMDEASSRVPWPGVEPGPLASDARGLTLCNLLLGKETHVYNVTWSDVAGVKWPTLPKSCTKCGTKTEKKPY